MLDEITVSKAITESFMKDFLEAMEVDVAIGGARPPKSTLVTQKLPSCTRTLRYIIAEDG